MAEKKQALLIFTKPPLPGVVKTRMTEEYGGFLTMRQAAQFYKCCFYDVCTMGMQALGELQAMNDAKVAADSNADKIAYDFFCSTTPAESLEEVRDIFEKVGPWPMKVNLIVDTGSTFDEHFNDACDQIFAMGYEHIVAIGGDVPTMPKSHIIQSFQWLDYFHSLGKPGFVYAPCQECGTSLVGYSFDTPMNHTGVYYNMDGRPALDGYLAKLQEADVPSAYFDPVADVDEVTDLGHAISCMKAIREAAKYQPLFVPHRTLNWVEFMGITVSTPPNDNHDPRDYIDGKADSDEAANPGEPQGNGAAPQADSDAEGTGEPGASDAGQGYEAEDGELTDEDKRRIAEGVEALREAQAAENAYEASKYE